MAITITGATFLDGVTIQAGQTIVTSGLALYLDPSNAASYAGTGSTVTDLSGLSHNATLGGSTAPTFVSSPIKSFQYTQTGDYSNGNKMYTSSNFLGDDMTVQVWINTTNIGPGTQHYTLMYIMAGEQGGGAPDWGFGVNSSGKVAFGDGPTDTTFASSASVNTGAWINVAATRNKSTGLIKLYVNGSPDGSGTGNAGNSLTAATQIWIGDGQDGPAYTMGGLIGSVLAYTAVLSDSDILNNYNATKATYGL